MLRETINNLFNPSLATKSIEICVICVICGLYTHKKVVLLFLYELDTAVLGAAFFRFVVSDGFVGALTNGTEVEGIAAEAFESLDDGLSTLLRERVVDLVGTLIVGMSLNLKASARVLLHVVGDLLDLSHRLRLQRSLAGLE